MKRLFTVLLAAVFCITLAVSALAGDYTLDGEGNAVYDNAIGYVFHIDSVNGSIKGEDSTVLTSADGLANCGVWAIWFVADKVSDNVYTASTDGAAMGGTAPSVTLKADQVIFVIHSSTSNPSQGDQYPNWEDKVAALAVKKGDYLALTGVDLAAATASEGKLTVTKTQAEAEAIVAASPVDTSKDEPSEPAVESSEEEAASSVEPSSEAAPESSAAGTASPAESTAASSDSSVKTSEVTSDGGFPWVWVIVGVVVVVIIVVAVILGKKKK